MQYRQFGRTNLAMPVFSCGGMRYQYKWQDVPGWRIPGNKQKNLEATIRRSIELGINHIETARGYGTSELQLGRILPRFPRNEIIVQTKISPSNDPQEFAKTFDKSLSNLKLNYDKVKEFDLCQCLINSPHADKIPALLAEAHELLGGGEVKRLSQE